MATPAIVIADPTTGRPPPARRWIPLSLQMFVGMLMLAGFCGAGIGANACRRYMAIREIERIGGRVHMRPRGSEDLGPQIEDNWTSICCICDDVDVVYFGSSSRLTDNRLAEIAPYLRTLNGVDLLVLDLTDDVTDAGVEHLKGLTGLKILGLHTSTVTDTGVADLQMALPGLTINRY